jgi:hypothetical protein
VAAASVVRWCRARRLACRLSLLALTALVSGWVLAGEASAASPYGSSSILGGISWNESQKARYAHGSDIWDSMWASDGLVYGAWGDGNGFAYPSKHQIGIGSFTGSDPLTLTGADVYGGSAPASSCVTASTVGGKPHGVVALPNQTMYMFHPSQDHCSPVWLAKSTTNGVSWTSQVGTLTWPDANGFSPGSILQTGQAQAGALVKESTTTPYLYIYGGKTGDPAGSGKQYLARVPASPSNAIENKSNWEYYSGDGSGNATWNSSSAMATPVFTDPDHAQTMEVTFDKAVGRYIAYNDHGTACGGGPCERQVGLFDAPSPWGPWTTFDYEENFDNTGCTTNCLGDQEAVGWSLMQKWMSPDGLTIWPGYSSVDWGTTNLYDSENFIKGTVTMASGTSVKGISTSTGTPVVTDRLTLSNPGNIELIDRTYRWTTIPSAYLNKEVIRLGNVDKSNSSTNYLSFTITQTENVCVAYDTLATLPSWLSSWTNTGDNLVGHETHRVYRKNFTAGTVTLGGNASSHDAYEVIINC